MEIKTLDGTPVEIFLTPSDISFLRRPLGGLRPRSTSWNGGHRQGGQLEIPAEFRKDGALYLRVMHGLGRLLSGQADERPSNGARIRGSELPLRMVLAVVSECVNLTPEGRDSPEAAALREPVTTPISPVDHKADCLAEPAFYADQGAFRPEGRPVN